MLASTRNPTGRTPVGLDLPAPREDIVRSLAIQHLERVRKLKLDVAAFLLGTVVIGAVWAITEYQNSGGWPHRLSDNGGPGDWNPWILWVVLGWGFLVALDALKTHFRRPSTQAEIEREVSRLTSAR